MEKEITSKVEDVVLNCLIKAESEYPNKNFDIPVIKYDLKGVVAGQCIYIGIIRLNSFLLRENLEDFLENTIPHEVAHYIAVKVFGSLIKPHGKEWKMIMNLLGVFPVRCHSYDVGRVKRKRT